VGFKIVVPIAARNPAVASADPAKASSFGGNEIR
jgi:hypothetical protein